MVAIIYNLQTPNSFYSITYDVFINMFLSVHNLLVSIHTCNLLAKNAWNMHFHLFSISAELLSDSSGISTQESLV